MGRGQGAAATLDAVPAPRRGGAVREDSAGGGAAGAREDARRLHILTADGLADEEQVPGERPFPPAIAGVIADTFFGAGERHRDHLAQPILYRDLSSRDDMRDNEMRVVFRCADGRRLSVISSPSPWMSVLSPAGNGKFLDRPRPRHDVFDEWEHWIGADVTCPHIALTQGATAALTADEAAGVLRRFTVGDYGDGTPDRARYNVGGTFILVRDGAMPPGTNAGRDPITSPGPIMVMLPEED
jgi:hypothetical protein